jgi:hypothetical protein
MDQAALSNDVVPGPLKDEISGNYDPSQETHEEYLQRINLERPFNMAEGGSTIPIGPRAMVGEITNEQTQFGRPIYQTPAGEKVSEKSVTLFFNGDWMNVPSIHGGKSFNEDELRLMIKRGNIEPTSVHKSRADAEAAAEARSNSMVQGPRNMYNQGQLVAPSVDGSRPGYGGKDQYVLSDEVKKKIKEKIKLKPGQKWNFYNPKTGKGHTFGVKKGDPNYDIARNLKPGRLEAKLKQAKETYKKIKADPDLLAQKKAYDRERFLRIRDVKNEEANLKYAIDKDFREKKLEWAKQDRIKNPEKYKKKMSDYYAKKGKFPPGNNYKENVWHDMFRSSQKGGQSRFLLVDESGKLLTPDKFPIKDGKVRWDVGGAYKNAKFYDTKTKQFVKFDNTIKGKGIGFEKYLDQKEVGGKGAFKNATYGYKIKDDYKNLSFKDSKGRTISLGKFMQDRLIDGNDFIKSGINVQHADLNNAFWKNEVSLASSNQELKNLEMNVERDLRAANKIDDVKLKNIAKNKALGTFKTKIEKLPGGITKVIEGVTYGTAPTERGLIQAAGKEFGATRYKDFANLLKKLCPKGQASGGRIGFATGTPTVQCGRKALDKSLATGKWESPEKAKLAKKILQTAGKSGLAGKIGSRIAAELLGPVALASIPVFELGVAGYDTVTAGTPFKEAVNKTLLHYVAGDKWKADPEKLKRKDILKMSDGPEKEMLINLWSNMGNLDRLNNLYEKQYDLEQNKDLSEAVDIGEYGDEGVSVAGIDKQIKDVENQIQRAGGEEAFYNLSEAAMDPSSRGLAESKEGELLAKRKADSLWGSMPNPYYTSPNSAYKGEVKPERIEAMKARGPSYGMWSPAGEEYEKLSPEYIKFLNEYYASEGIIPKDGDISQYYVATPYDVKETSMLEEEQIANKWKQLMSKPGMLGTQETFAGGGIASIRRPNAIPPESGPTPQGLPSMYNRVKRI